MTPHSSPVYAKTIAGRLSAFDPMSELPVELIRVLKLVDGKVPADDICLHPKAPSGAHYLLQELLARELIQEAPSRWLDSAGNSAYADSAKPIGRPESRPESRPAATFVSRSFADGQVNLLAPANQMAKARTMQELDEVKTFMNHFMEMHLPELSESVGSELADVNSYGQLNAMLGGYAELVSRAGPEGLAHIKTLRALIDTQAKEVRVSRVGINIELATVPALLR